MNISTFVYDWQHREGETATLSSRAVSKVTRAYTQNDVNRAIRQVSEGVSQMQAARNNNIPTGSIARLLPGGLVIRKKVKH